MTEIKTVAIIGAGQMGSGIAHVCALSGYNVLLNDISGDRIEAGLSLIDRNLARQVARGMVTMEQMQAAMPRIAATPAPVLRSRPR